jgi:hypothetical protein
MGSNDKEGRGQESTGMGAGIVRSMRRWVECIVELLLVGREAREGGALNLPEGDGEDRHP